MWNYIPKNGYDWETIKKDMKLYGLRNSLMVAPMPTASTSQILGNNESFEPYTTNLYTRRGINYKIYSIFYNNILISLKNNFILNI